MSPAKTPGDQKAGKRECRCLHPLCQALTLEVAWFLCLELIQVISFPPLQLPPQSSNNIPSPSVVRPRDDRSLLLVAGYITILCYLVLLAYLHLCLFILSSNKTLSSPALSWQDPDYYKIQLFVKEASTIYDVSLTPIW